MASPSKWKTAYFIQKSKNGKWNASPIRARNTDDMALNNDLNFDVLPTLPLGVNDEIKEEEQRMIISQMVYENGGTKIISHFCRGIEIAHSLQPFLLHFHNFVTQSVPVACGALSKGANASPRQKHFLPFVVRLMTAGKKVGESFLLLCANHEEENRLIDCPECYISRAATCIDFWCEQANKELLRGAADLTVRAARNLSWHLPLEK